MKKIAKPHIAKPHVVRPVRLPHTAFSTGGDKAFSDPKTMVMPDQAFSAAMAQPQGAPAPAMPEG